MVVPQALMPTAGFSVFLLTMFSLVLSGILVLLFHISFILYLIIYFIKKEGGPQLRDPLSFLVLIITILLKVLDSIVSSREATSFKILWSFKD